jgi:hypothetical protein
MKVYRSVSVGLPIEDYEKFKKLCKERKTSMYKFLKDKIEEVLK